jgi:NAD(P)H dehydrogenase (quinone)
MTCTDDLHWATGPFWAAGELANKVATGLTSAGNVHGGNESTLLALYNTMHHWGAIVVPPGYTDPLVYGAGGNLYRTAHASAGIKGADSPRSPS